MNIISYLRRVLISFLSKIIEIYNLLQLHYKYPECDFYPGAKISNTEFERFNVVYNDVIISSSKIGAHTYIQKKSTIFNAEIGRFCSIASGVSIGPGIHKTDGVTTHSAFYLKNSPLRKIYSKEDLFECSKRTKIGHDVWIGERAIIIDGVTIGTGAIIAAGAVVTKDVNAYSIVGGVPAKIIKYRFDPYLIQKLIDSYWWDQSEEWYEQHYSEFATPSDLSLLT
jgi:acetyltransferase-like isoleucine patch superfamily enzyme